jgi:XapX domain-containing protein
MLNYVIGVLLAFTIGAACRWFDLPVPAPPKVLGALLVVAMTLGYITADWYKGSRPTTNASAKVEVSQADARQ